MRHAALHDAAPACTGRHRSRRAHPRRTLLCGPPATPGRRFPSDYRARTDPRRYHRGVRLDQGEPHLTDLEEGEILIGWRAPASTQPAPFRRATGSALSGLRFQSAAGGGGRHQGRAVVAAAGRGRPMRRDYACVEASASRPSSAGPPASLSIGSLEFGGRPTPMPRRAPARRGGRDPDTPEFLEVTASALLRRASCSRNRPSSSTSASSMTSCASFLTSRSSSRRRRTRISPLPLAVTREIDGPPHPS